MPALLSPRSNEFADRRSEGVGANQPSPARWWIWGCVALLAGYLLFCHGCHGEEDTELFTRRAEVRPASRGA